MTPEDSELTNMLYLADELAQACGLKPADVCTDIRKTYAEFGPNDACVKLSVLVKRRISTLAKDSKELGDYKAKLGRLITSVGLEPIKYLGTDGSYDLPRFIRDAEKKVVDLEIKLKKALLENMRLRGSLVEGGRKGS